MEVKSLLFFDGIDLKIENVNLISSADGKFDDLSIDSVNFARARFDFLDFGELLDVPMDKVRECLPVIDVGDPKYLPTNYLCYPQGKKNRNTKQVPMFIFD